MSTRPASPADMAKMLAEIVVELGDNIACRIALGFAGFDDLQISTHLACAQRQARRLLAAEADRLHRRWLSHG